MIHFRATLKGMENKQIPFSLINGLVNCFDKYGDRMNHATLNTVLSLSVYIIKILQYRGYCMSQYQGSIATH